MLSSLLCGGPISPREMVLKVVRPGETVPRVEAPKKDILASGGNLPKIIRTFNIKGMAGRMLWRLGITEGRSDCQEHQTPGGTPGLLHTV